MQGPSTSIDEQELKKLMAKPLVKVCIFKETEFYETL